MTDMASLQMAIKSIQKLMEFKEEELGQFESAAASIQDDIGVLSRMSRKLFRQLKILLEEQLEEEDV